jgi:hypothetical protein
MATTPRDYSDLNARHEYQDLEVGDVFQITNHLGCYVVLAPVTISGERVELVTYLPTMLPVRAPRPTQKVIKVGRLAIADMDGDYESL